MPSRAELRGRVEIVLRVASVGIIAWMFWQSLDRKKYEYVVNARTATLSAGLRNWTRSGIAPDRISVQLDSVPSPRQRDWLSALRAAGSKVSWDGNIPAIGIEIQPIASPSGGYNAMLGAPPKSSVILGDEIGTIDTVLAGSGGARITVPSASGVVTATVSGSTARSTLPGPLRIRRILVIGSAGWESKFVIAALEEDGWKVDALAHVAPGVNVTQGSVSPIDTSRYAAVVALDRTASAYSSEIVRYAASGGGVVIAASAGGLESLASIRAGSIGRVQTASAIASEPGSVTLQSLSVLPVAALKSDAIPLDKRGGNVAVAARRFAGGRIVQLEYLDTWRWRMSGGETSVADHRKWWTNAVAGVAYAPFLSNALTNTVDAAPVARLVESLGPSSAATKATLGSAARSVSLWWLFAILSLSLLAEWISRRTRGMR